MGCTDVQNTQNWQSGNVLKHDLLNSIIHETDLYVDTQTDKEISCQLIRVRTNNSLCSLHDLKMKFCEKHSTDLDARCLDEMTSAPGFGNK